RWSVELSGKADLILISKRIMANRELPVLNRGGLICKLSYLTRIGLARSLQPRRFCSKNASKCTRSDCWHTLSQISHKSSGKYNLIHHYSPLYRERERERESISHLTSIDEFVSTGHGC